MIRYKLDGEFLDQFDKEDFAVTKQISKIGEINLRHGDFSTSFKVPLTTNNTRILRYTTQLNNASNTNNFDKYEGTLESANGVIISRGYYQVTGFSPTSREASIRFFGGNTEWFDLLKDRYINENAQGYNLSDFQVGYNADRVVESWDETFPYFFFLLDNGKNSLDPINAPGVGGAGETSNINQYGISYFEHRVFKKIFDSVGITLTGNLFNSPNYYKGLIAAKSSAENILTNEGSQKLYRTSVNSKALDNLGVDPTAFVNLNFNIGEPNSEWSGNVFTASTDILNLEFVSQLTVEGNNITNVQIKIVKNGVEFIDTLTVTNGTNFYDYVYTNTAVPGDVFEFSYGAVYSVAGGFANVIGNQFSGFQIGDNRPLLNGDNTLPRIKQTDFIKEIMVRYGIVSQYDSRTKTLQLDRFDTIELNIPNAPDWTNKIDLSKDINVDYTKILSNYAKKSQFEFDNDDDNDLQLRAESFSGTRENLGTGTIDVENDFLDDVSTIYTSIYAPTASEGGFRVIGVADPFNKVYVPKIPYFKLASATEYEDNDVKPRLLYCAGKVPLSAFNSEGLTSVDIDSSVGQQTEIGYAYFAKIRQTEAGSEELNNILGSLMFSNNRNQFLQGNGLLDENYGLYKRILNNPYYVSLYMNLSSLDIQQVDFLTPIYLSYKYDSGYYYIDSIDQFKGDGTTTKVNLVKI